MRTLELSLALVITTAACAPSSDVRVSRANGNTIIENTHLRLTVCDDSLAITGVVVKGWDGHDLFTGASDVPSGLWCEVAGSRVSFRYKSHRVDKVENGLGSGTIVSISGTREIGKTKIRASLRIGLYAGKRFAHIQSV